MSEGPRNPVLLVCSPGGHLRQLHRLHEAVWSAYPHLWVTLPAADSRAVLAGERVAWAYGPTNRSLANLLRNIVLAYRLLRRERPVCIISSGAGVGVPFIWLGRLMGIHTLYLESFARSERLSLSGWLVYFVAHEFLVQHEALARRYRRALFVGSVYG